MLRRRRGLDVKREGGILQEARSTLENSFQDDRLVPMGLEGGSREGGGMRDEEEGGRSEERGGR